MKSITVNKTSVTYDNDIKLDEAMHYYEYVQAKSKNALDYLIITSDGEHAELEWKFKTTPFERIRRITGYLTGTTDTWNPSKHAEEKDRVKHGTDMERI